MTFALRLTHANDNRQLSKALTAVVIVVLGLFAAVAAFVVFGTSPAGLLSGGGQRALAMGMPECAAALARAKAAKSLPSGQAVAASTAMLRACRTPA